MDFSKKKEEDMISVFLTIFYMYFLFKTVQLIADFFYSSHFQKLKIQRWNIFYKI